MADENTKPADAAVTDSLAPAPVPEAAKPAGKAIKADPAPEPVKPVAEPVKAVKAETASEPTKPVDEPAKPAKASKPATVTVINTSGLKFRLGWANEDELSLLLPGENKGVDADLFDAWAKQHADSDLVKNGVITKK